MPEYIIREANLNDAEFIVEAIIEAEKSGSEIFSYSRVFNLSEDELRSIFRSMLLEEIDGCEFSISNYLVAEKDGVPAGTIGAWVERSESPSSLIKSNLLGYFLPESAIMYAARNAKVTSELYIEHTKDALSLVVVYISPAHRGKHLFELLANAHVEKHKEAGELSIQVMSNNFRAIRSYERYGFRTALTTRSENETIKQFLPHDEKILMKMTLKK